MCRNLVVADAKTPLPFPMFNPKDLVGVEVIRLDFAEDDTRHLQARRNLDGFEYATVTRVHHRRKGSPRRAELKRSILCDLLFDHLGPDQPQSLNFFPIVLVPSMVCPVFVIVWVHFASFKDTHGVRRGLSTLGASEAADTASICALYALLM